MAEKTPPERGRDPDYEAMLLLDRLETLREDMEELGITTRADLEARIEALHRQLDREEHHPRDR